MKKSLFRPGHKYFHMNLDFQTHPFLKEFDWIFIQKNLDCLQKKFAVQLHALVMMDTHVHLLVKSDNQQENYFCEAFKTALAEAKPTEPSIECHCEPVPNYTHYLNTYKYIYRNPVEAGLVQKVEDYPYSSLRGLLGLGVLRCEVIDHLGVIQNPFHHLNWMNHQHEHKFSKLQEFGRTSL